MGTRVAGDVISAGPGGPGARHNGAGLRRGGPGGLPTPARSRLLLSTTPARLRLLLIVLVLLSLAWGAFAGFTASQYSSAATGVVNVREPLSLDAEQIYARLSDADDAATTAFLAGGLEPPAVRQRYLADISAAGTGIEQAAAQGGDAGTGTVATDLRTLAVQLPVYTGEVETARADNRLGLPLGAAYLREASALMRGTLLPAAQGMYLAENASLAALSSHATSVPLLGAAIAVGAGLVCILLAASLWLARRTNRVLNMGLIAAALAGVISLGWLAAGYSAAHGDLRTAQAQGSAPVQALARVDIALLQAHADESLTLIDNTGDDAYQQDYLLQEKTLGPGAGTLLTAAQRAARGSPAAVAATEVVSDAQDWFESHIAVRALDNGGNHPAAVRAVLTADASASGGPFGLLTTDLAAAMAEDQAAFDLHARAGAGAFAPLEGEAIVTALVMAAGCAWGLSRRLAEYQ